MELTDLARVSWPPNLRDMLASPTYQVYCMVSGLGAENQKPGSLPTEPFPHPLCGLHAPGNLPNRVLRAPDSSKRKQYFQECFHQLKSFRDQNRSPGQSGVSVGGWPKSMGTGSREEIHSHYHVFLILKTETKRSLSLFGG